MAIVSQETLYAYWSASEIATNALVILNMLGALALGLLVGYERAYHGRAAGMRTYGLVCMASAALTVISGYPSFWFGGAEFQIAPDPTRVIQGIVTGVGFLGAGVIMKEGFNISGLTTAASIWAASAIGVMVGVGFYASAIMLALLCAVCMLWVSKLESWLPSRPAIAISLRFTPGLVPDEKRLRAAAASRGYDIAGGTIAIQYDRGAQEWRFVAVAFDRRKVAPLSSLANELATFEGVEQYQLSHARN
jgi:putative Mg2+ transporter-C (MgtC) family protein